MYHQGDELRQASAPSGERGHRIILISREPEMILVLSMSAGRIHVLTTGERYICMASVDVQRFANR